MENYDSDYELFCYNHCCTKQPYPPCFVCGQKSSLVCSNELCTVPPFACRDRCISDFSNKMHRHSAHQDKWVFYGQIDERIQKMNAGNNMTMYREHFNDVKKRTDEMKELFTKGYQKYRENVAKGFKLVPGKGCQKFCERMQARSFDYSTGSEVALFMSEGGVVYENEEESKRVIEHEKKRFEKMLKEIERIFQQYILDDSLRVTHERGKEIFSEGKQLMQQQKYDQAVEKYLQSQKSLIAQPSVYLLAGNCYKQIQNYQQSKHQYTLCLSLSPTSIPALQSVAQVSDILKTPLESIEYYTRLIEIKKGDGRYYFGRGKCYVVLKDLKKGLIDFDKAIKLQKGNQEYEEWKRKAMLGLAYGDQEDQGQSEEESDEQ